MNETEYSARIDAAADDVMELRRIADELNRFEGAVAAELRRRAIARRLWLGRIEPQRDQLRLKEAERRKDGQAGNGVTPAIGSAWLGKLGVTRPDGRPLYRYRLSEDAFDWLQSFLISQRNTLGIASGKERSAQFVLWAAEWFRRCYDGTTQKWEALGTTLGVDLSWNDWRHLTDTGLRFWGIAPLRLNGIHHRLAAIARQGGFPCAAIDRAAGWPPKFLEALVAELSGVSDPNLEIADAIAGRLIALIPDIWRSDQIRVVSAELAMEVVRLRREAEANDVPAGVLVSAWLDQSRPGWRDDLPLPVATEAGRNLIDGLMRVVTMRGGHEAVRCSRWLELGPNGRREGVDLTLAGLIKDASGKALTSALANDWSRLRLYASTAFAQHFSGELAVADPDGEGEWRARPSTARTHIELPFNVPVVAELRGGGRRVVPPFALAGGEAVRSELRVLVRDDEHRPDAGLRLRLAGTGSGGFRDETLFVDVPRQWTVEPHVETGTCETIVQGNTDNREIWEITGGAIVTSDRGDRYLVRAGQKATSRDRLLIDGERVPGCEATERGQILIKGPLAARVIEGGRERGAGPDEIWWRPLGTGSWRRGLAPAGPGSCEFAWRDKDTGHIRDRRDAIILPASFSVSSHRHGDWHEVKVDGWPGSIAASAGTESVSGGWRLPAKGNTRSCIHLTLASVEGEATAIAVPLRHQAWIESWSDGPTQRNARLSISTLNRYVARVDGRCELMGDLLDRNGRVVPQSQANWWVDDELPLSSIRDDVAALLRPYGDIRASIRLNFNDGHEDHWFVSEFEHELKDEGDGFVPEPAIAEAGVRVVTRSLAEPERELDDGGVYSLLDSVNHRPIVLPRHYGPTLLYLRADDRILSCPRVDVGEPLAKPPQTPLGRIMAIGSTVDRAEAFRKFADEMLSERTTARSRSFIRQLIELALSLGGLPPATFDALSLLSERPQLGTTMLFQARTEELEPVMRLAEGLPFAWWLIPERDWSAAQSSQADYLFEHFPEDLKAVAQWLGQRRSDIALLDPVLSPFVGGERYGEPLDVAANAFLNRSGDRMGRSAASPFRPRLNDRLPHWRFGPAFWRALDAPVAAALAASGSVTLTGPEIGCCKDIARKHPRWYREGFDAALTECSNG